MSLSRDPQVFDFDPDILVDIKPKIYGSRLNSIPGRRVGAVGLDPGSEAYREDERRLIPDLKTHSKWFEHYG